MFKPASGPFGNIPLLLFHVENIYTTFKEVIYSGYGTQELGHDNLTPKTNRIINYKRNITFIRIAHSYA